MKKLLPIAFCGLAAVSFSQLTLAQYGAGAGADTKGSASTGASTDVQTPSRAGPTDNPNVNRDAQGREHVNKGKHTGQTKNKKDRDDSTSEGKRDKDDRFAGSGSTSAPSASGSTSSDAASKSDSTSGARSSDSTRPPSGASVSGKASESASGSATTQ
jgi:hypothetical protein